SAAHAHGQHGRDHHHDHHHGHDHHHCHGHADIRRIDTGHGVIAVEVFEHGVPPRWRIRTESGERWGAGDVSVTTERPGGARQAFAFVDRGDVLESVDEIPEPHEFTAEVKLGHAGHVHSYALSFVEGDGHHHVHHDQPGIDAAADPN